MLIQMLAARLEQTRVIRRSKTLQRPLTVLLLTVLWLAPLLIAGAWISTRSAHHDKATSKGAVVTSATPLWAQWEHIATTTDPQFTSPQTASSLAIDPAFAGYYTAHAGGMLLGSALTPALPTSLGLVQFFTAGALLQPTAQIQALLKQQQVQTHGTSTSHQSAIPQIFGPTTQQMLHDSLYASDGSVVQVEIFHTLLSAGSTLPIDVGNGSLSYADLRSALQPSRLITSPPESALSTTSHIRTTPNVFIAEGQKGAASVGHTIPDIFWRYMTRSDIAPDGWAFDIGQPLTEALPMISIRNGQIHHLTVQAFWNTVLVTDNDAPDSTGQPIVQPLDIGRAYLQTFGPPTLAIHPNEPVWGIGDTAVLDAPSSNTAKIHVGQAFPFTLMGDTQWANGALSYHVHWLTPRSSGDGWVSASALTFTSPGAAPAWASFDVLSPDLAKYLAAHGQNSAAVVYDVTHNQYYTYNPDGQFIMASSAKVPIMLTLLTKLEDQGRGPNDEEMYLLTTMIENSDNNSAQALFDEIGGAPAMDAFMRRVNVPGLAPNPDAWGWSTVSPMAMVRLLTLLQEGKILNTHDRSLALNLMRNVESDQRIGVGDTAPQGASIALKDGWVPAPDGLWAMNSSGIVSVGGETYIIAVYTQHENSLDDGWNITRHVCAAIAQSLA